MQCITRTIYCSTHPYCIHHTVWYITQYGTVYSTVHHTAQYTVVHYTSYYYLNPKISECARCCHVVLVLLRIVYGLCGAGYKPSVCYTVRGHYGFITSIPLLDGCYLRDKTHRDTDTQTKRDTDRCKGSENMVRKIILPVQFIALSFCMLEISKRKSKRNTNSLISP